MSAVRGRVLIAGDDGYDVGRQVWNAMIDRRPAAIVQCVGSADVVATVRFARERDLLVSVRGGGHNVAGRAVADGALMIDLSGMRSVHVDPAMATGLSCDDVASVDLVTHTGEYLHVSEREHPELLWALRGGGGNFGVATAFELRLQPVGPTVYGGPMLWPAACARDVVAAYVGLCADLPDELALFAGLVPNPETMDPMVAIIPGWFGPRDRAEAALGPVRALGPVADLAGPIPYVGLQSMLDDAVPHGLPRYWKSGYFDDFPDTAVAVIADADDAKPTPISLQLFFHQHGAATRVAVEESAFPHRSCAWDFDAIAQWTEPDHAAAGVAWARHVWDQLAPRSTGVYVNHLDADDDTRVANAYGPNYQRLVNLKQKYDPDNFFRLNNNIVPA